MKKLIAFLIIFCLLCGLIIGGLVKMILNFQQQNNKARSQEGIKLPEVTLKEINGRKIKFHTLQQPTILCFWLPQSDSCQLQLSILSEINQNYNLKIIGIAIGAVDKSKVKEIKQEKQIKFPLAIDEKTALTQKFKITTIPTLIFYQSTVDSKTITGLKSKTKLKTLINNYFQLN